MRSEELRLGNLIRYGNPIHKDLPIHKITGIMAHSFWLDGSVVSSENSNVIGIPLTEEWLLKFGFKHVNGYGFRKNNSPFNAIKLMDSIGYIFKCHSINIVVKYVHQLQNVFYALTGQQLTL